MGTFAYLFFLAISVIVIRLLPLHRRWLAMLGASLLFYGLVSVEALLLMAGLGTTTWLLGLAWDAPAGHWSRKLHSLWLPMGLLLNIGALAYFKYAAGGTTAWTAFFPQYNPTRLLIPLGLSIYTFKAIGYLLDVRRGALPALRHPGHFALYLCFYPLMQAGPVERISRLLPQFLAPAQPDFAMEREALAFLLLGMFKKLVIADRLGAFTAHVFTFPDASSPEVLLAGCLLFPVELYADFSGYSDLALGSALFMGIRVMANFDRPFLATSLRDFWQRWHISLTLWLRDYVMRPLSLTFTSPLARKLLPLPMMLLMALWHGLTPGFFFFGLMQGLLLTFSGLRRSVRRLPRAAPSGAMIWLHQTGRLLLALPIVVVSVLLIRSANLPQAWSNLVRIVSSPGWTGADSFAHGLDPYQWGIAWWAIATLLLVEIWNIPRRAPLALARWPLPLRWLTVYGVVFLLLAMTYSTPGDFLYARF